MGYKPQASKSKRNIYKQKQLLFRNRTTQRVDVQPDIRKKNRGFHCLIGDVVLARLNGEGSVQKGVRPCVIINVNQGRNLLTVVPLTKQRVKYVNQIMLIDRCLKLPSVALCDTQITIDKIQVIQHWGRMEKQNFIMITNEIKKILAKSRARENKIWL